MREWTRLLVAGGVLIGLSVTTLAGAPTLITPVSQTRTTSAETSFTSPEFTDFDSQNDAALDFGPFNSSVNASIKVFDPNTGPVIGASATQNSAIFDSSFFGQGTAGANAEPGTGAGTGTGQSAFFFEFSIATTVNYTLSGSIDASSQFTGSGQASVTLDGPGGTLYTLSTSGGPQAIGANGTLAPGTYTLTATADASTALAQDDATASFDFTLSVVPEPAAGLSMLMLLLAGALRRR